MSHRDPFAVRYARRLLGRLDLPTEAGALLGHPRYWTPEVCSLFCDACDERIVAEPTSALAMVRVAPLLAQQLTDSGQRRTLLARSLGLLAEANRLAGFKTEAEPLFRTAFQLALRAGVRSRVEAELHRRFSAFLLDLGRIRDAAKAAQSAVDLLKGEVDDGGEIQLGAAMLQRGAVRVYQLRHADGIDDFGFALALLDPRSQAPRFETALRRLERAAALAPEPRLLQRARRHLVAVRRRLTGERFAGARRKLLQSEDRLASLGPANRAGPTPVSSGHEHSPQDPCALSLGSS